MKLNISSFSFLMSLFIFCIGLTFSSFSKVVEKYPINYFSTFFRIYPYLQISPKGNYILTWFGNSITNSSIKVYIDDQLFYEIKNVQGEKVPALDYVKFELGQTIEGLAKASWLHSGNPIKYEIQLPIFPPNKLVRYEVDLNTETYRASFKSAPSRDDWEIIKFAVLSDSETEPLGRILRREWEAGKIEGGSRPNIENSLWVKKYGKANVKGQEVLRYPLTEKEGYSANLKAVNNSEIDLLLMPGDLVQGGGYQPAWDEFFRHNAGEFDQGLSKYPILPALGNWENFGGINGAYGINDDGKFAPKVGRDKFFSYFIAGGISEKGQKKPFYRVDYGPITFLTLDSSKGIPDDKRSNYQGDQKVKGNQLTLIGNDTQEHFSWEQYQSFGGDDIFPFNEGSEQWNWVLEQLEDAKKNNQLIFVQFHHSPFSSGEHGFPMNHELSTGQGGTPLRIYHKLFEKYGVLAVFSGHSEIFERSFVDEDGDGVGVHYYDVGVAGDGLRGEAKDPLNPMLPLKYNPYQKWSADQFEPEMWESANEIAYLKEGGKHYAHLLIEVKKIKSQPSDYAEIKFSPTYLFPVLSENYDSYQLDKRVYKDLVVLQVNLKKQGQDNKEKEKEQQNELTEKIKVFPNPFQHQIDVLLPLENAEIKTGYLQDFFGRQYALPLKEKSANRISFNTSEIPNGRYFLILKEDKQPAKFFKMIKSTN